MSAGLVPTAPEDFFQGCLDDHFDAGFESMALPWLPWVGSQYRVSPCKTIVLGESIYLYGDGSDTMRTRILAKDSLRRRHMRHAVLAMFKTAYVRNLERAVFRKKTPSASQRKSLWVSVAYHNLVLRMLESRQHRPSADDYQHGWQTFLRLASLLQAERCIVYGVEPEKIDAFRFAAAQPASNCSDVRVRRGARVGRFRPVRISLMLDRRPFEMMFIRHPSAFFSWGEWGTALREANMLLDPAEPAVRPPVQPVRQA
jgi:hypothetical protein